MNFSSYAEFIGAGYWELSEKGALRSFCAVSSKVQKSGLYIQVRILCVSALWLPLAVTARYQTCHQLFGRKYAEF